MYGDILWLTERKIKYGVTSLLSKFLLGAKIEPTDVEYLYATETCTLPAKSKTTFKTTYVVDPKKINLFFSRIEKKRPKLIILNDPIALEYLSAGQYSTLFTVRGSIYYYKDIPIIPVDSVYKTTTTEAGAFFLRADLNKAGRWLRGQQRHEPLFDHFVCKTLGQVTNVLKIVQEGVVCAIDIETSGKLISCIGYSVLTKDSKVLSFTIPFVTMLSANGSFWRSNAEEVAVWKLIQQINSTDTPKVMQGGSTYDSAWFVAYGIAPINYVFDTLVMFHSLWPEAPKSLDIIASVCLDFYTYWKDEAKFNAEDGEGSLPFTALGEERYHRYNGKDCHYTLLSLNFLLKMVKPGHWSADNYAKKFKAGVNELLAMSMRGIKINSSIRRVLLNKLDKEYNAASEIIQQATGHADFNPNSPKQVADLFYDLLGLPEVPKKGRSTVDAVLQIATDGNVMATILYDMLMDVKRTAKTISMYGGDDCILNGRFMYGLSNTTTPTDRLNSKGHSFWVGKNIQNVPRKMRPMFVPDNGYYLVEIDYAQSDAYFTAFESGDAAFIETMRSGKDTHCVHAAKFFKVGYDEILAAAKAGEDWAVHPTKGIRQNTKRVVYGCNYFMQSFTLLLTMGKEAVIASAKFLGYEDAHTWKLDKLARFCDKYLLDVYYEMYPEIKASIQEKALKATREGNIAVTAFGYTRFFFGDLLGDAALQRRFAAFFGQGGTAGNINLAFDRLYDEVDSPRTMLLAQVHDSALLQVEKKLLHQAMPAILECFNNEVNVRGEKFLVPVDVKVGNGWGERMMAYKPTVTAQDIELYDEKWHIKHTGSPKVFGGAGTTEILSCQPALAGQ